MNNSIFRLLPVAGQGHDIDESVGSAFGYGEILMFCPGDRVTQGGDDVYFRVDIDIIALRELIWKGLDGSTTITVPNLGLEGELTVRDGLVTFRGVNYRLVPGDYTSYVLHAA